MRRKQLELDDSVLDEETVDKNELLIYQKPSSRLINTKVGELQKPYLKPKLNMDMLDKEEWDYKENRSKNEAEERERGGDNSEYDFENGISDLKRQYTDNVMEVLKINNDSHLTIKTKRSSKFSLSKLNSSDKLDLGEMKLKRKHKRMGKSSKELGFRNNYKQQEDKRDTIKRLDSPKKAHQKKKANFKFDLNLINTGSKKTRVVYPHSCKNANMKPILEPDDLPFSPDYHAEEDELASFESNKNKRKESHVLLHVDSAYLKRSEKSDDDKYLQIKVKAYEQKIERLKLDQRMKIDNYKSILAEKDSALQEMRKDLLFFKNKCVEYEEGIGVQKEINQISKAKIEALEKQIKEQQTIIQRNSKNQLTGISKKPIQQNKSERRDFQIEEDGYQIEFQLISKTDKFVKATKNQGKNKQTNNVGDPNYQKKYLQSFRKQNRKKMSRSFKTAVHSTTNKLSKYKPIQPKQFQMLKWKDKRKLSDTPIKVEEPINTFSVSENKFFSNNKKNSFTVKDSKKGKQPISKKSKDNKSLNSKLNSNN